MSGLTPRQYADFTLGFGVIFTVRYGLLGNGSGVELSVAAAGVVLLVAGGLWRVRTR